MSTIRKILMLSFQSVLFIFSLVVLFYAFGVYDKLYNTTYNLVLSDNLISDRTTIQEETYKITRSDILAELMKKNLDFDIEIIDKNYRYIIEALEHSPDKIVNIVLESDVYNKTYIYDNIGNTVKIIFIYCD